MKKKNRKMIYKFLILVFLCSSIYSLFGIRSYLNRNKLDSVEFGSLKDLAMEDSDSTGYIGINKYVWGEENKSDEFEIGKNNSDTDSDISDVPPDENDNVNPDYEVDENGDYVVGPSVDIKKDDTKNEDLDTINFGSLKELNPDFVAWIKIDGTNIDYPVMQSNNEPDLYWRKNFYKRYSNMGTPYAEEWCDVDKPSDNITIYGHHMKDGSMFANLEYFEKKDFYDKHKYITLDTENYIGTYEIITIYKTVVYTGKDDEFKFWEFKDAENEEEFNNFINTTKNLQLYDTGVSAEYGDKLISLVTCEYSKTNGRLVVVAKLIDRVNK